MLFNTITFPPQGTKNFYANDISNILVNNVISNNVYENQIKQSRNLIIVAGDVSNNEASLAYSHEGFYWLSISGSADIFNYRANTVKCNGDKWVAVGVSNNTIAFSEDGYKWHGLGKYYLDIEGICIESGYDEDDNKLWVAGGEGTYNLVYSYDGFNWTTLGDNIFSTKCNTVLWNGYMWIAGGEGTNTLAYSYDGINWTGLGTILETCNTVSWNGHMWFIGGRCTSPTASYDRLAYSYDGINWTSVPLCSAITYSMFCG